MSDQSVHGTSSRQIPPEIYAQELVDVRARRGRLFGGNTGGRLPSPAETVAPSATHSLVGLALSGGGIRSATFNLGVLQALSQQGLLGHVDYLSTVSGGGYIGSSLSSIVNGSSTGGATKGQRPGVAWGANFPFAHVQGAEESAAIHQLRNFSNYLAPGGVFRHAEDSCVVAAGHDRELVSRTPRRRFGGCTDGAGRPRHQFLCRMAGVASVGRSGHAPRLCRRCNRFGTHPANQLGHERLLPEALGLGAWSRGVHRCSRPAAGDCRPL